MAPTLLDSLHRFGLGLGFFGVALVAMPASAQPPNDLERVFYDWVMPDGRLTGGFAWLPKPDLTNIEPIPAPVTVLWDPGVGHDGPAQNLIDLVIVGDGYQHHELGLYAVHAQNTVNHLLTQEPFATYRNFFRVYRVDVVSPESGITNDPIQGITRNTALNMHFWCAGIERLLCVDVPLAYAYAGAAPYGVDQVLAIGNSTKYGGAGYPQSDLATVAGGNAFAPEIAVHEFGHSIGNLADEYDYGDGAVYAGPEPDERNTSIHPEPQMRQWQQKWHLWLGENDPQFDGLVGTYEGSHLHQYGIYRPTRDSKMRSLGRPFNLPSVEALLMQFYFIVRPIMNHGPTNHPLNGSEILFVEVNQSLGIGYTIQWMLNDQPIPGAVGPRLRLGTLNLNRLQVYRIEAHVKDETPWVRDVLPTALLTDRRIWVAFVTQYPCYADCEQSTGPRVLDIFDFLCFGNEFVAGDVYACDCDMSTGQGVCDIFDFLCFGNAFSAGCW